MGKHKKPKAGVSVSGEKQPKVGNEPDSYFLKNPVWKFSNCDREHDRWKISEDKFDEDFIEKLISYERMTWGDIFQTYGGKTKGTNNHYVSVVDFCKEAQERVKNLKIDEYQEFFSLRLAGRSRLWGILMDGIFHVLWKDDLHEVCPSEKRNT